MTLVPTFQVRKAILTEVPAQPGDCSWQSPVTNEDWNVESTHTVIDKYFSTWIIFTGLPLFYLSVKHGGVRLCSMFFMDLICLGAY